MKTKTVKSRAAGDAESAKTMRPDNATILATIKAHATTKTYAEIAALLGLSRRHVARVGRRAGFRKLYVSKELRAKRDHQRKVILAHASTHTLKEIGCMLGVTNERVRQLCEKWRIERHSFGCSPLHWMSRLQLRKLVRQPDKTMVEIAGEAGVSAGTLRDELRRRGIEPFTKRERDARLLKRGMRVCGRCLHTKPIEQFTRAASHSSGYRNYCLECGSAYAKARWKRKATAKR